MDASFKSIAKFVCIALIIVFVILNIFTNFFAVVKYYGDGMEPGISNHQTLLILKTDRLSDGDITAFFYNNKALVRRVICTGGSQISMDDAGVVSVNGKAIEEPYVESPSKGQCNITFPYNVPVNSYFVMGDNRAVAMDSRLAEIGPVSKDRIIGKVIFAL